MKKKILSLFIIFSMLTAVMPQLAFAEEPDLSGTGTSSNPYIIENADSLSELASFVNNGGKTEGMYFRQKRNITAESSFKGIGSADKPFEGIYDGSNYTLTLNLTSANEFIGCFTSIGENGSVKNLTIGGSVTNTAERGANYFVGAVAGENYGTIQNCTNKAKVSADYATGDYCVLAGIVGYNYGKITTCYNEADLEIKNAAAVAGIVGASYGRAKDNAAKIERCGNRGDITAVGSVSGIAGAINKYTTIDKCYNRANIKSEDYAAGIVCDARTDGCGAIIKCYNQGSVSAGSKMAGGIAAAVSNTDLQGCYNTGSVECTRTSNSNKIGGIAGDAAWSNIYLCYNTAAVTGNSSQDSIGGIAGEFGYTSQTSVMESCYNTGSVSGNSGGYVGGIVGINYSIHTRSLYNTGSVTAEGDSAYAGGIAGGNMLRDGSSASISHSHNVGTITVSGQDSKKGGITGTNSGAINSCYYLANTADSADGDSSTDGALSSMSSETSFDGWDFDYTWEISSSLNYPVLTSKGTSENNPFYMIPEDFIKFAGLVNAGNTYIGKYFAIRSGMELSGEFTPIGGENMPFMGVFDGGGHTIAGLSISKNSGYNGFFGYIGNEGRVQNLTVEGTITLDAAVTSYTGAVAGYNEGIIEACTNNASISVTGGNNNTYTGGITGFNDGGIVELNHNGAPLSAAAGNGTDYIGSVAGFNDHSGEVTNNYSDADVTVTGEVCAGGIVGSMSPSSKTRYCYYYGSSGSGVKGISGDGDGYEDCYYLSSQSGSDGAAILDAQFAQESTFLGWDFEKIWQMSDSLKRPILQDFDEALPDEDIEIEGYGTEEYPYEISTAKELKAVRDNINKGNTADGVYFVLVDDIDLEDQEWTPIGTNDSPFKGYFDGRNYTVSGLNSKLEITEQKWLSSGLFGFAEGGCIQNLVVEGNINADEVLLDSSAGTYIYAAPIVGKTFQETITNCHSRAAITAYVPKDYYVGGIAGYAESSTVQDCISESSIFLPKSSCDRAGYIGGIAGAASAVKKCTNYGSIVTEGAGCNIAGIVSDIEQFHTPSYQIGGIINSYGKGEVTDCVNEGQITVYESEEYQRVSRGSIKIAGIAGNYAMTRRCVNNGYISAALRVTDRENDIYIGGVGAFSCSTEMCENHGNIDLRLIKQATSSTTGSKIELSVGGIQGRMSPGTTSSLIDSDHLMFNCYSDGDVTINADDDISRKDNQFFELYVGGAVGFIDTKSPMYCYTTGKVIVDTGNNYNTPYLDSFGNVRRDAEYCYFKNDNSDGVNSNYYSEAKGLNSDKFTVSNYFENWDFSYTWDMDWTLKRPVLRAGGSEEDPYIIDSADKLIALSEGASKGNSFQNRHFLLTENIDLTGVEWTPIGDYVSGWNSFDGVFDGNGNEIKGLNISKGTDNSSTWYYAGLFGECGEESVIKNLSVSGEINVAGTGGDPTVGAIAALTAGTIENCSSDMKITGLCIGSLYIGGIVGKTDGYDAVIKNCSARGNITVSNSSNGDQSYVGGIAGYVRAIGYITECRNDADIDSVFSESGQKGTIISGGIAGYVASVNDKVTSTNLISLCRNSGRVSGNKYIGGIAGQCNGNSDYDGDYRSSIEDCYNEGEIHIPENISSGMSAGGIIGSGGDKVQIINCYSCGGFTLDADTESYYGIAPSKGDGDTLIRNSYCLDNVAYSHGSSGGNMSTEEIITKNMFASQDTFNGWDFSSVWKMDNAIGRPVLIYEGERDVLIGELEGEGTEENPYQIPDYQAIKAVRDYVNNGNDTSGLYFRQTADIDLEGFDTYDKEIGVKAWIPIGNEACKFKGHYDGGVYNIRNIYINYDGSYVGLFGLIDREGEVRNVVTESGSIESADGGGYVGGVAGECDGTLYNCVNKADILYGGSAGGVCGYTPDGSTISNLGNEGSVSGSNAGGVIGYCVTDAKNLYNTGDVRGLLYTGGIIGYLIDGKVDVLYNTGSVSSRTYTPGQLIGEARGVGEYLSNGYAADTTSYAVANDGGVKAAGIDIEALKNGEFTYTLDGLQTDRGVWGQKIGADEHPTFVRDAELKVYKVIFRTDNGSEPYYTEYANSDSTLVMPKEPSSDYYNFRYWTADEANKTKYEKTNLTEDLTLYAVGEEKYGAITTTTGLSTTYGESAEMDLSTILQFVTKEYENDGTESAGKFTYSITDNGGCSGAAVSGDILSIPDTINAGKYVISITAERKQVFVSELMLMAVDYDTAPVNFTVTANVGKASQIISSPTAKACGSKRILLNPVEGYGTMQYAALKNSANTGVEPEWQTSLLLDNLEQSTNYYVYAMTEGDENHYGAISPVTVISTIEHEHEWLYTVEGNTITALCTNNKFNQCPNPDGGVLTLADYTADIVYDGKPHPPLVTDKLLTDDPVEYSYSYKADGSNTYTSVSGAVKAGEYEVTVQVSDKSLTTSYRILKTNDPSFVQSQTVAAIYGQTLGEVKLPEGYKWKDDLNTPVGDVGEHTFDVTYIPPDSVDYVSEEGTVTVEVSPRAEEIIDASNAVIDYAGERITGFEAGSYSVISGDVQFNLQVASDGAIDIKEICFGKDILIVRRARNENYIDSKTIVIPIKARPAAPEVTSHRSNSMSDATGSITGVDDTMEYTKASDSQWTQVESGKTEITCLTFGTYYVRVKQSGKEFAGKIKVVVIGIADGVTATFIDGNDKIIKTDHIATGASPSYNTETDPVPQKESTAQYEYTFSGWDKDVTKPVFEDTEYTAQFESTLREYTVYWLVPGQDITAETYKYGDLPIGPKPSGASTPQYVLSFAGWDPELQTVTGNTYYKALFDKQPRTYRVTLNPDGGTIDEAANVTEYTYGVGAELPDAGDVLKDGYKLLGWLDNDGNIINSISATETGDKEYTAVWARQRQQETIIPARSVVVDYGNETLSDFESGFYTVSVGNESRTVEVTDGTIKIDENCFGETIYITHLARNENYVNSMTISLKVDARPDAPANLASEAASGEGITDGIITGVDDTMEYSRATETDWEPVGEGKTQIDGLEAGVYNVRYASTDTRFASGNAVVFVGMSDYVLAVFMDGNGSPLKHEYIKSGEAPSYDAQTDGVPQKESTAQYEYTFSGWDKDIGEPITENTLYIAQFDAYLRKYTVKWMVDGVSSAEIYTYGDMPKYKGETQKEGDECYSYLFEGWYPQIQQVTGDESYYAIYEKVANTYTVTLNTNGGTLAAGSNVTSYTYGIAKSLPSPDSITRPGYSFLGWYDADGEAVTKIEADETGDKEYIAKWAGREILPSYIDGVEIEMLTDESGITFNITSDDENMPVIIVYKAVYNADKSLKEVSHSVSAKYENGTLSYTLTEPVLQAGESCKFLLWTMAQQPITDALCFP